MSLTDSCHCIEFMEIVKCLYTSCVSRGTCAEITFAFAECAFDRHPSLSSSALATAALHKQQQRCAQIFRSKVKGVATPKGIAFPTCVSVNECVTNNSPLESEASKHVRRKGKGRELGRGADMTQGGGVEM